MRIRVSIGGLVIELTGEPSVAAALERKFAAFLVAGARANPTASEPPDLSLRFEAPVSDFSPEFHLEEGEPLTLTRAALDDDAAGERVILDGAAHGWLRLPAAGTGQLAHGVLVGAQHLGHVDALMRLGLSLLLPARGALLLHASAVLLGEGDEAAVFCGHSGRGKSTAARALGRALADELVVVHVGAQGLEVSGTPYWNGSNERRRLRRLVCLERDEAGPGGLATLGGPRALAAISPHVARYVPVPEVDRAVFGLLAQAVALRPVDHLACPVGPSYVPFLRAMLETRLGGS